MARPIELHPDDLAAPWGPTLASQASEALDIAELRLGVALDAPPLIRTIAPESAFYAYLGRRPHRIVAVARAAGNEVIINRGQYLIVSRYERRQILIHEFVHLILGRRVPSEIPRWLDEGLAQLVAGEGSIEGSARVAAGASFGGLVPLETLWGGPHVGVIDQNLSYAQSLSATKFFLESGAWGPWGSRDGVPEMVRKLADPVHGRALRDLLNDPGFIRAFDRRWRESLQTFWSWIAALSSGGIFWAGISALFLLAWWRKRRMDEIKEAEWLAEDEAALLHAAQLDAIEAEALAMDASFAGGMAAAESAWGDTATHTLETRTGESTSSSGSGIVVSSRVPPQISRSTSSTGAVGLGAAALPSLPPPASPADTSNDGSDESAGDKPSADDEPSSDTDCPTSDELSDDETEDDDFDDPLDDWLEDEDEEGHKYAEDED